MQEISPNVDTIALSKAKDVADLPFVRLTKHCNSSTRANIKDVYDASESFGNKTYSFNGIKRLRAFNEWVFKRDESIIIVGGHSIWFRSFFQTFLPFSSTHDAKKKKIVNSGVVAFELSSVQDTDGSYIYRIAPESVLTLHGGFEKK